MGHSNIWNAHPKTYGPGSRACRVCGNSHGIIRKYGLICCRQCFRSNAKEIGFIKQFGVRRCAEATTQAVLFDLRERKWEIQSKSGSGVKKYGTRNWKNIQSDPEFKNLVSSLSNIDLKDKWRKLT